MIMYRQGLPLIPQELLGHYLGLLVDKKDKKLFWNVRTGKRPPAGYGTQMKNKQFEINSVFKRLRIPLTVATYYIRNFKKKELIFLISNSIKRNEDLIAMLASDVLNNTKNNNGHACVIDRIYPVKNLIRLIDPSAVQPKWREIKIDKFIKAVMFHPTGEGRILKLTRIK
ncbi:MAG: hypothetical protein WC508_03675 [Patescibacteria group bacterium]